MSGKRQTNQQQLASGTDGRGETPVAATDNQRDQEPVGACRAQAQGDKATCLTRRTSVALGSCRFIRSPQTMLVNSRPDGGD